MLNEILFIKKIVSNACSTSPCLNGGTCQVTGTGSTFSCQCAAGYSGTNCQICIFFFY